MDGVNELLKVMQEGKKQSGGQTGLMMGTIRQVAPDPLKLYTNGMEHEHEDLWLADGLQSKLQADDTVLIYTPDAQVYYILVKVVKA